MSTIRTIRNLIDAGMADDEIIETLAESDNLELAERGDDFYSASPAYGGFGDCLRNDAGEWLGA